MIFLSYWFVLFALIVFPLYYLIPVAWLRMLFLLGTCAFFHTHFAGPAGVLPIIILAVITYLTALTRNKRLCELAITICVLALVFYKYTKFICQSIIGIVSTQTGLDALKAMEPILPEMPPLAISFFTFEFVHYLYEIRRGEKPIKNPLEFSVFAIFWPSIVSGPIKRYQQFIPSLQNAVKNVSTSDVAMGMCRVAWGLFQKAIADNCRLYTDDRSYGGFETDTIGWRWVFLFAHAARIYLDFAGYSDIAIGYARMMGIKLPENFNWPYISRNMVDFWQRWHISLSTWIRDYVYIPLGGGTHGPLTRARNALIAFVLCGLWHGAAWNFALWGIYHGVGVIVATFYQSLPGGKAFAKALETNRFLNKIWAFLSWSITFMYVCFGWLLFFYPVKEAARIARLLFVQR